MSKGKITAPQPQQFEFNIDGFELTATGMNVHGRPTYDSYLRAGEAIKKANKASGWWLAEWIAYGETRADWKELLEDAIDQGNVSLNTVKTYGYIQRNVPVENRVEEVDFSHHAAVASLPKDEQRYWLERARDEDWSKRELLVEIRASKRVRVVSGQAKLEGMYRIILADPPWKYSDSGPTIDGSLGKVERRYPQMTIEELCKLPVAEHALPDAILFCWVTATMLYESPGPREVIEAWGFQPKTGWVWDKVLGMPGHYSHVQHEHLIIATRGKNNGMDVPVPQPRSIFVERRSGEHSAKPEYARQTIQKHWTTGPYLELFGRSNVEGWDVFGNDPRLWNQEVTK